LDQTYVVSSVEVSGASTLSPEALVQASGMKGVHAFFLSPAKAARRVAEIPSVLTTTVRVGWPSQAHITVAEREPVMVWDQVGDRFWVDKDGRLMQARQESGGLLVLLSQEPERLSPGDQIPADVLAGAQQLRRERPNIVSLFYERGAGLSYQDGRNWRAYFGTGRDMNQKLSVYETLVEDLQARGLHPEYISVVNKEKPFYRLSERTG
jgi:cell division septal protein FtsQ